jgi:hypothetical protein
VLLKLQGLRRHRHSDEPKRSRRRASSSPFVDVSTASTSSTAAHAASLVEGQGAGNGPCVTSSEDLRAGLMSRQVGSLNVWKAPVEGPPVPVSAALRYAKRCSRSPSPIPRRKVSFRLSATTSGSLASVAADTENLSESFSTFDDTNQRQSVRTHSMAESASSTISSSFSSVKSSLKVSRQSVSVGRTYDPTLILQEDDDGVKRVAFSTVSVHLHSMTLGDNPAVSAGVPVQIDWTPTESFTKALDEYEKGKDTGDRPSRSVQQLRIGPTRRENLLKEAGEDRGDVLCVLRSIALIQASRAKNAGAVSVDAASSSSTSTQIDHSPPSSSQRIRSGTPLPKVLQRFVVNKPTAQPA